jgi:hypothetical protein
MMRTKIRRRGSRQLLPILAAVLMLSGPGCASLQLLNFKAAEKLPAADAKHPPIEVLAVWQAAEGPGAGGIPTRGFAGQIFFFTEDRATPVVVDGNARIYVFDNHGSAQEQTKPLRQFDFDRQSWAAHVQTTKLGATYGVFIPYPRNDYHQAICSLRVRFTPTKGGRPLFSASSTIELPGPPVKPEPDAAQAQVVSPLNNLAKKLQAQSLPQRTWQKPLVDTTPRPISPTDPQAIAAELRATAAQPPVPVMASSGVPYSPGNYSPNPYGPGSYTPGYYAAGPPIQAAGGNPIVQTGATTDGAPGGASPGAIVTAGYSAGAPDSLAANGSVSSGRFKLQAAAVHADWSSEMPREADEDDRATQTPAGTARVGPNHPLAD